MEIFPRATRTLRSGSALLVMMFVCGAESTAWSAELGRSIEFKRNDDKGQLQILIRGKEALVYCYGKELDLPHFYPVRSPSGKSMTVQQTEPFPHHRSFWFADTVQIAGQRQASFYNALYSGVGDRQNPQPPFRDRVRHIDFTPQSSGTQEAAIGMRLLWEMDDGKIPVLDEVRDLRVVVLGDGEYFLDLRFQLTAGYADVTFRSDAVHYAWPFIRLNADFNAEGGGIIVNSEGQSTQAGTNLKVAKWLDFSRSGTPDAEGLAMFSHPSNEQPHVWLTRDYGCIGPRRVEARSGKPFTLKQGESIATRVGVLIHQGDVKSGRVAERYEDYAAGRL